jgi:hypothetical protein
VIGANSGPFTLQFFNASGTMIGASTQTATNSFFGFATTGDDLFRAVSITNTDPAGIAFDNVTFHGATTVSEPGGLALVAPALTGLGLRSRKRREQAAA